MPEKTDAQKRAAKAAKTRQLRKAADSKLREDLARAKGKLSAIEKLIDKGWIPGGTKQ